MDTLVKVVSLPENLKLNYVNTTGIVTALCPYIGYSKASSLVKNALKENRNIRYIVIMENIMTAEEIDKILDTVNMNN